MNIRGTSETVRVSMVIHRDSSVTLDSQDFASTNDTIYSRILAHDITISGNFAAGKVDFGDGLYIFTVTQYGTVTMTSEGMLINYL